ncbi:unnamed protein product [Ostreobium quekettii]|uniref:Secreted protein n=1 Tax=Ostreobium quekettii TaxID=121088 RepID=A0A8S1IQ98_9CHLO|nr:unnamed protein product [Ostreobium quekettii]
MAKTFCQFSWWPLQHCLLLQCLSRAPHRHLSFFLRQERVLEINAAVSVVLITAHARRRGFGAVPWQPEAVLPQLPSVNPTARTKATPAWWMQQQGKVRATVCGSWQ